MEETIHSTLQQAFDQPLTVLRHELAERLSRELAAAREAAGAEAACAAKRATIEALAVAVRRIRHASSIPEVGVALLETVTPYCGRAALMVHKGDLLTGWRAAGFNSVGQPFAEAWSRFQMASSRAPALAQVVETRDAVISLGQPDHLSPELFELLAAPPDEKVYLLPVLVRQKVVAILYADAPGSPDRIQPAALEILCSVAEATIEVLSVRPSPARAEEEEARREPSVAPAPPAPPDWEALSPEERDMHLRAQRFARLLVADLQLYRAAEIREGRQMRNLYGRLKEEIDKSREAYYRKFGQTAAGMDYFHVELLRTLAGDDEGLLGPDYPGPTVGALMG